MCRHDEIVLDQIKIEMGARLVHDELIVLPPELSRPALHPLMKASDPIPHGKICVLEVPMQHGVARVAMLMFVAYGWCYTVSAYNVVCTYMCIFINFRVQ